MFNEEEMLYPDSLVGTDSHTTMINGLGVVGWGVGGKCDPRFSNTFHKSPTQEYLQFNLGNSEGR